MRTPALILALLGGAGLLLMATDAGSMMNPDPMTPDPSNDGNTGIATTDDKVAAFLAIIRHLESGNDYYVIAGDGGHFSDDSTHPYNNGFLQQRTPPAHLFVNGRSIPTTASGAYQINFSTWLEFAKKTGIWGFTPAEQDALGAAILANTGAIAYLEQNDVTGALRRASTRWASLPFSTANQNPVTLATALQLYESALS